MLSFGFERSKTRNVHADAAFAVENLADECVCITRLLSSIFKRWIVDTSALGLQKGEIFMRDDAAVHIAF